MATVTPAGDEHRRGVIGRLVESRCSHQDAVLATVPAGMIEARLLAVSYSKLE
jgi:hypothetical protein